MRKNFKKLLKIILLTVLIVSFTVPAYATSLDEEQQKQEELESDLDNAQETLDKLQSLKSDTYAYLQELDKSLDSINAEISELQAQSNEKQKQINDAQDQIAEKQARIDEQYAAMKKRIQFMYENAETGYIDMILGSKNLSDFLNKAEYLSQITQYDRSMITQFAEAKAEVEKIKAQLEADKTDIETLKAEQKAKQDDVQVLTNEKNSELQNYTYQISVAEKLEKELQSQLQAQKNKIASLVAEYDKNSDNPQYTGGTMLFPLATYKKISTYYGWDVLNGEKRWHNGVDIAAAEGTSIMAAESGKVVWARKSDSAGNYIIIYHGNGIYTEYMHCSGFAISEGQTVSRGQVIGYVGNTGYSFGAHLHFGVATGFPPNDSNRINPAPYLGI